MTSLLLDDPFVASNNFYPRKSTIKDIQHTIVKGYEGVDLYCYYESCSNKGMINNCLEYFGLVKKSKTILYFHGNGELVVYSDEFVFSNFKKGLINAGFNVFAVEYRGYGHSSGTPSFTTIFKDLPFVRDYLLNTLKIADSDIIVYGRSIGGLYAAEYGKRYKIATVIECAFSDPTPLVLRRIPKDNQWWANNSKDKLIEEIKENINVANKLRQFDDHVPLLILHAADDELITKDHALANYEASNTKEKYKRLVLYPIGQHNYFHAANSDSYDFEGSHFDSIFLEIQKFSNITSTTVSF